MFVAVAVGSCPLRISYLVDSSLPTSSNLHISHVSSTSHTRLLHHPPGRAKRPTGEGSARQEREDLRPHGAQQLRAGRPPERSRSATREPDETERNGARSLLELETRIHSW